MTAPTNCMKCPALVACRHHVVNGAGKGSKVMFVATNPDFWADQKDYAFYGRQGKLLASLLQAANIPTSDIYRTYAVRCMTPGRPARKPKVEEMRNCRPFLIDEIRAVNPDVIVTLGPEPLAVLIGMPDMAVHRQAVADWERQRLNDRHAWQADVARWTGWDKASRGPKPKAPKPAPKPQPPKNKAVTLKDVTGHILIQPDTGIPVIPSYALTYLLAGNWEHSAVSIKHYEKAYAMATGDMPWEAGGTPPEYPIIDTMDKLRALRDYLLSPGVDTIWFDCETGNEGKGLKWMESELLCWSFAGGPGEGFVFPLLYNAGNADYMPELFPAWHGHMPEVIQILRDIFGSDKDKGGHNVLFDIRNLMRKASAFVRAATAFGITVNGRIKDTELLSHSIEESVPHNMTNLLAYHTTFPYYENDIKKYKKNMNRAPNKEMWNYSGADAEVLPLLWDSMRPIAEAEGTAWALDNVTSKMLDVCLEIEDAGLPIDRAHFDALCLFYIDQIEEEEQKLWAATPHRAPGWKYNDPKVLREVLFKELKLPKSGRKTKGGRGCEDCSDGVCFDHDQTGKDALEDLIKLHGIVHPALPALMRLKNLTKRRGTYLDGSDGKSGFLQHIQPDGRIHCTMKISRTETGRLASEEPNGQNIPNYVHIHQFGDTCHGTKGGCQGPGCKSDKHDEHCTAFYAQTYGLNTTNAFHDMIKAPPGYMIMNVDWSQLEVWVLAYTLKERLGSTTLLDVLESGQDIHLWMARQMFSEVDPEMSDKDWKDAHPELRRRAKTANFGIGYGLTVQGFMLRERCTEDEAKETINRYKAIVPIDDYFRLIREDIERGMYVENWAGRRRHITYLAILKALGMSTELEGAVREAINFPIQSGGSDVHSIASRQTLEYIKSGPLKGRDVRIIGSVHDSLTLLVAAPTEEFVRETAWIIKDLWRRVAWEQLRPNGSPLYWKVPCEVEVGQTWGTSEYTMNAKGDWDTA